MRLHNFLVDYRDEHSKEDNNVNERKIFREDILNSEATIMVVGNDNRAPGRLTNQDKYNRERGMLVRDKLRISLMNHDMHRARKEEWVEDAHSYIARTD